jgi:hypothetical protein
MKYRILSIALMLAFSGAAQAIAVGAHAVAVSAHPASVAHPVVAARPAPVAARVTPAPRPVVTPVIVVPRATPSAKCEKGKKDCK